MGGGDQVPQALPGQNEMKMREEKSRESREVYKVLVTGFGAFPNGRDPTTPYTENDNTSHLICNHLPGSLPSHSRFNPTPYPIEILNPTAGDGNAIPTSYRAIRTHLPSLWSRYGDKVDLILHLGMADGWPFYSLERGAWKEGTVRSGPRVVEGNPAQSWVRGGAEFEWPRDKYYMIPDNEGETVEDLEDDEKGVLHPWKGTEWPDKLLVKGFDVDGVVDDVNAVIDGEVNRAEEDDGNAITIEDIDVGDDISGNDEVDQQAVDRPKRPKALMLPHPEGGDYCCGFISYDSLANKRRGNHSALSAFCHIPGWKDEKSLKRGADVICALMGVLMGRLEDGK